MESLFENTLKLKGTPSFEVYLKVEKNAYVVTVTVTSLNIIYYCGTRTIEYEEELIH